MTRRNLRIPTLPTRTQIARLRQMENERDAALLSLDENKLRSYLDRWGGNCLRLFLATLACFGRLSTRPVRLFLRCLKWHAKKAAHGCVTMAFCPLRRR